MTDTHAQTKPANKKPEKKGLQFGVTTKYFLMSLGIFLVIVIFGGIIFKPNLPNDVIVKEDPLIKNTELAIKPGEIYVYNYDINNTNNTLTFMIKTGSNCTFIQVKESVNATGSCIDKNGNDKKGGNVSLEVGYISMFKPWMLAVHGSWHWNARMTVDVAGSEIELKNISFDTVDEERILGRESFVVEITSDNLHIATWIDKEKRILLKEKGNDYEIKLVSAPFELNDTGG